MTALILTPQQISVSLEDKEGELRLDSRIMAAGFGVKSHKDYQYDTLRKYEKQLAELGAVLNRPLPNGEVVWYLNQAQVNFAGTLARNTEKAVAFKLNLVKAFEIAKRVIPALSEELQLSQLQNENLNLRLRLAEQTSTLVALHGESLGLAIAGFDGQVVEVRIPTTEVVNPVTGYSDEFLSATQLSTEVKRRTGQNIKNADFIRKLKAANRDDLILPVTRNATCEYVQVEDLDEAIKVVFGNSKQGILKPVGQIIPSRE